MNLLFYHQNFPGQFKSWAPAMARMGHRVVCIGDKANIGHRTDWKFNGDFVIQVVPVQFNDFKAANSPIEEYGKYFDYFKEMFYKMMILKNKYLTSY